MGYTIYKAKYRPLRLLWDLDHTLLCSVCPFPQYSDPASALPPTAYFDQQDDDFECVADVPNTRTCWRPGARTALWLLSSIAQQHVFTAAQQSYTENILLRLDPNGTLFESVTHRDLDEAKDCVHRGKDVTLVVGKQPDDLCRTILFDDKVKNFQPQPANGIHVNAYKVEHVGSNDVREMFRLVAICVMALWMPHDCRPLLSQFRSSEHHAHCFAKNC